MEQPHIFTPIEGKALLVFDLDGTLVDSAGQIFEALNQSCLELRLDQIPNDLFKERLGLPIKAIVSDLELSEADEIVLVDLFRIKLRTQIENSNAIFEGVEKFLGMAKLMGYSMAIATSKPTYLAELVVSKSPLANYIDFTQGTEGFPAKPAPDVILKCLNHFQTRNAVMFGDRIEDVISANASGISSIGVAQGYHTIKNLTDSGASLGFNNFLEIVENSDQIWALLRDNT